MSNTYEVIIRNGRIEWAGDPPPQVRGDQPIHARLMLHETETLRAARGVRMAQAMEKLSQMTDTGLPRDPDRWLAQEREDRSLPGRAPE